MIEAEHGQGRARHSLLSPLSAYGVLLRCTPERREVSHPHAATTSASPVVPPTRIKTPSGGGRLAKFRTSLGPSRENSISLVPVYSAETRPIGKIGCDDCISSLDTVGTFTTGRSDADSPAGVTG